MAFLQLLGLQNTPDERLDDSQHWSKGASTHTWHVKSGPEVRRLFALGNEEVAGGPATMRWWGCLKLVNGTRDEAVLLPLGSIHHSRWWDGYGIYKQELKVTFRVALFNLTTRRRCGRRGGSRVRPSAHAWPLRCVIVPKWLTVHHVCARDRPTLRAGVDAPDKQAMKALVGHVRAAISAADAEGMPMPSAETEQSDEDDAETWTTGPGQ